MRGDFGVNRWGHPSEGVLVQDPSNELVPPDTEDDGFGSSLVEPRWNRAAVSLGDRRGPKGRKPTRNLAALGPGHDVNALGKGPGVTVYQANLDD